MTAAPVVHMPAARLRVPGLAAGDGELSVVRSPFNGEAIAEVAVGHAAAVDAALQAATAHFADRDGWLPVYRRKAILDAAGQIMAERRDELAVLIASEGGKPLVDARVEVDRAIGGVRLAGEEAGRVAGEEVPMGATAATDGRMAFTTREPIGVVAAISAFNHPLNLVVHQVAPAVATGCPVIVKPASATPLSCLAFADILAEAGLPEGWCIPLPGSGRVGERLATSPAVAFVSFIGSAAVGWALRAKLAPGTRCALEHGGVAPLLVDASADLDRAAALILKGGFYHAGQVCVSVQRVFADAAVKEALVERLVDGIAGLRTGDPLSPETDVGPLITADAVERVHAWVGEAAEAGATVAAGGQPLEGQCYAPTLLVDTPRHTRAMSEEVFGPVVNVVAVASLQEAIEEANALPWAFQAGVVTRDLDEAVLAARRLNATAVMVNDHTAFRADWMPFGGRGRSGLGLGGIPYTVEELTQPKLVVLPARQ